MELSLALGIILITGYFFGLVAEKLSLPRITFYLLAGLLFSEGLLGHLLNLKFHLWSEPFSQVCLGFIAYIVGGEINLKTFRHNGRIILWGAVFESLMAVIFVFLTFYILTFFLEIPKEVAFILASIAATTAPAATVAVIEQYKTKGELTDSLLGIVALDDAFGIIIFIIISSLYFPTEADAGVIFFSREIFLSLLIGSVLGFGLSKFSKLSISNDFLFPLLVGLILLIVSLSQTFHFSHLLACIILGVTANNSNVKDCERVSLLLPIQHIEEFIFITFFTFAGTHFSAKYFSEGFIYIFFYVVARGTGKYIGAYLGTAMGHPKNKSTSKWMGLGLLPQAGVAIGLVFQVIHFPQVQEMKGLIFNIILGSTVIYEFIGPITAKIALIKAGEITNNS